MSINGIRARTKMVDRIREYLRDLGFEEVVPKIFSQEIINEPAIYPFKTEDNKYFLQTSPETYLKKAMANGIGNCFMISPAFRNLEGTGRWHQPEFLMVEWYKFNTDWKDQIEFTQQLIEYILDYKHKTWPILSWEELWQKYVKIDLKGICESDSLEWARNRGYNIENATWEQIFNQISDNEIIKKLSRNSFFLIGYPARISPLAKPQTEKPWLAERFELYLKGVEIANGNSEWKEKKWAGVGLGIDRLTALKEGVSVREVQET